MQRRGQRVISSRSRVDAVLLLLFRQVHQCKASATLLEAAGVLVDFHFEVNLGAGQMRERARSPAVGAHDSGLKIVIFVSKFADELQCLDFMVSNGDFGEVKFEWFVGIAAGVLDVGRRLFGDFDGETAQGDIERTSKGLCADIVPKLSCHFCHLWLFWSQA